MSSSKKTTDHNAIKSWAESRHGVPAIIKGTGSSDEGGVLRIHFPKASQDNESFDEVSWPDFFRKFDDNHLAMLYQEKKEDGETSTFHKFVDRD